MVVLLILSFLPWCLGVVQAEATYACHSISTSSAFVGHGRSLLKNNKKHDYFATTGWNALSHGSSGSSKTTSFGTGRAMSSTMTQTPIQLAYDVKEDDEEESSQGGSSSFSSPALLNMLKSQSNQKRPYDPSDSTAGLNTKPKKVGGFASKLPPSEYYNSLVDKTKSTSGSSEDITKSVATSNKTSSTPTTKSYFPFAKGKPQQPQQKSTTSSSSTTTSTSTSSSPPITKTSSSGDTSSFSVSSSSSSAPPFMSPPSSLSSAPPSFRSSPPPASSTTRITTTGSTNKDNAVATSTATTAPISSGAFSSSSSRSSITSTTPRSNSSSTTTSVSQKQTPPSLSTSSYSSLINNPTTKTNNKTTSAPPSSYSSLIGGGTSSSGTSSTSSSSTMSSVPSTANSSSKSISRTIEEATSKAIINTPSTTNQDTTQKNEYSSSSVSPSSSLSSSPTLSSSSSSSSTTRATPLTPNTTPPTATTTPSSTTISSTDSENIDTTSRSSTLSPTTAFSTTTNNAVDTSTPNNIKHTRLVPRETSTSGVVYQDVFDGISQLYPPSDESLRNAKSRTDGYWPFVSKGDKPPEGLTYGEFSVEFYAQLLDHVADLLQQQQQRPKSLQTSMSFQYDDDLETLYNDNQNTQSFLTQEEASNNVNYPIYYTTSSPRTSSPRAGITSFHSANHDHNNESYHQMFYNNCYQTEEGEVTLDEYAHHTRSHTSDPEEYSFYEQSTPLPDVNMVGGIPSTVTSNLNYQSYPYYDLPDAASIQQSILSQPQQPPQVMSPSLIRDEETSTSATTTSSPTATSNHFYNDRIVCDIGSGTGRLVAAAAALHPTLYKSKGIEVLPSIHDEAIQIIRDQCWDEITGTMSLSSERMPMSNVELLCGDVTLEDNTDLEDVDVAFVFSTCMPPDLMTEIGKAVCRQMQRGTILITIDQPVPPTEGLDLLDMVDGTNTLVGGTSTAYIYQRV